MSIALSILAGVVANGLFQVVRVVYHIYSAKRHTERLTTIVNLLGRIYYLEQKILERHVTHESYEG